MNTSRSMIPMPRSVQISRAQLCLMLIELGVWLVPLSSEAQIGPMHATAPTHVTLMDCAAANAGSLSTPLTFTSTQTNMMRSGAYDEDSGLRSRDHAYNPINNGYFTFGQPARDAAVERWSSMEAAFRNGNRDGGDDSGAWHYLGRTSHLLMDMTSPMHVFCLYHTGITEPTCKFEEYWQNNESSLRSILSSIGGPLHSSTLDSTASEKLDSWSASRLQYRFENSCPNKTNDDVRGWMEVLAWTTYFRTTFWGEVTMGDPPFPYLDKSGSAASPTTTQTGFSDGTVGSQSNVLYSMFSGNVHWRTTWDTDWFFEITDRNGSVFRWMSFTDIDDWSACGRTGAAGGWSPGEQDSSKRIGNGDDDDANIRNTGRFFFDLRELGKDTSGQDNRRCYPYRYPNGASMTNDLHEYFGQALFPLTVRYNAGLLGLANRRVTVRTADSTEANGFSWGRMDNFGNPVLFRIGSAGSNFFFVAKSSVTLTAPATNSQGGAFVQWLLNGSTFSGNTNRTITINDSSIPIPASGIIYTAEYVAGDGDGDGIPDSWMLQYFGHPTGMASDNSRASDDADGDGQNNLTEFLAGMDPTNSVSAFCITSILRQGGDMLITWNTCGGKTNVVQATTGDAKGSYTTNAFSDLATIAVIGDGVTTTNYIDVGGANTPNPQLQYQLTGTDVWSPQTWDLHAIAAAAGAIELPYRYQGYHAWAGVTVFLNAYVIHNGVTTVTNLVNLGPVSCCDPPSGGFDLSGSVTLNVQAGDTFGFQFGGQNFDTDTRLLGTFTIPLCKYAPWSGSGPGDVSVVEGCRPARYYRIKVSN